MSEFHLAICLYVDWSVAVSFFQAEDGIRYWSVTGVQTCALPIYLRSFGWISNQVAALCEDRAPFWWWALFIPSFMALCLLGAMLSYQISTGVGVWGNMHPVMWAWDIVNFVWWIGIGHAGTLISAILFLLRQRWRTAVNRAAEAMTIFAVMCAGIYPAMHVGRVWYDWL